MIDSQKRSRLCENSLAAQFKRRKFLGWVISPCWHVTRAPGSDELATNVHAVNESPEFSHSLGPFCEDASGPAWRDPQSSICRGLRMRNYHNLKKHVYWNAATWSACLMLTQAV